MGRKTWQSLPKQPLDGRDNIVVSQNGAFKSEGAYVVSDASSAVRLGRKLAADRGVGEVAVIGGAAVYQALLGEVDRIYWTTVHGSPEGDTFFPDFRLDEWKVISDEPIPRGPNDEFAASLRVLERTAGDSG